MDRMTPFRDGKLFQVPVAANTEIFGGHLVAVNAAGFAVPASANAASLTLGISDGWVDNTSGHDGDAYVLVSRDRFFLMVNSSTDPVTQAALGRDCYVVDSVTVAKTSDAGARPLAGKVTGLEGNGVWIHI